MSSPHGLERGSTDQLSLEVLPDPQPVPGDPEAPSTSVGLVRTSDKNPRRH